MSKKVPANKSAEKSAGKGQPFRKGRDSRRGNGPKKGAPNAGRPPDVFRMMCREIASTGAEALVAKRVLKNPKHPAFLSALKWATEHGYGKMPQEVQHTGKGGQPIEVHHQGATVYVPSNNRKDQT